MKDFGFVLNTLDFSDRVLRIETISEKYYVNSKRKRRGENIPFLPAATDDSSSDLEYCSISTIVKITTLNINSRILASESAFFYKLFENGMKESQQKKVTMRINASEEAALMDVLNFMYINILSATMIPDLRAVLVVADKFGVTSCMRYCSQKLPKALEQEHCYREPSCVLVGELVQPLKDAAKKYLVERYREFTKYQEEAMALPLSALEVVLGSDGLQVESEENVFYFILKWGYAHYPNQKDRQEILTDRLAQFIYFPYMCSWKLTRRVLVCPDFDLVEMSKLVMNSLQFNAGYPYGQHMLIESRHIKRVYTYRPIKVEYFKSPLPRCVVYFCLTKEECENLFQSGKLYSQKFFLGDRQCLHLSARCNKDNFGLFVYRPEGKGVAYTIDYEFAVSKKLSKEFESAHKVDNCTIIGDDELGKEDLFGISWTGFMDEDSEYFIDGILHLQAEITLKNSET